MASQRHNMFGPMRDAISRVASCCAVVLLSAGLSLSAAGDAGAETLLATGSGFLVNQNGWVLTNAHVVEGCSSMGIDGQGVSQSIVVDDGSDLALVLFPGLRGRPHLVFSDRSTRLVEPVVALGYPLTTLLGEDIRATTGSVSSLSGVQSDQRFIQISAPLQSGNSGGPILDAQGLVIGIATAVLSDEVAISPQNVNFATTAAEARRFLMVSGINFTERPPGEASRDLADIVEAAVGATFLMRCFGPGTSQAPPATVSDRTGLAPLPPMILTSGLDALGFDFLRISDMTVRECELACLDNRRCVAFTFNTRHNVCFLKDEALLYVRNPDAVAGVARQLQPQMFETGMSIRADVDSPGGDYARIRGTDFVQCTLECGVDPQCRAFAFVRRTGDCWLKDRTGPVVSMPGVEFGQR